MEYQPVLQQNARAVRFARGRRRAVHRYGQALS